MSFFRLLARRHRQRKYQRSKPQTRRANLELLESRTLVTADLLTSVPLAIYSTASADISAAADTSEGGTVDAPGTSSAAAAVAAMRYVLTITDASGNALTGPLNVGDKFWVQISVQDTRAGLATAGLLEAGTAVTYDSALASTTGQAKPGTSYPDNFTKDLSTPGKFAVDASEHFEIGSSGFVPLGSGLLVLASVEMQANAAGTINFQTTFPTTDPTGEHSVIAVDDGSGNPGYVPVANVTQASTSITVASTATHIAVTTQPPTTVAHGAAFDLKVAVQNAQGGTVTDFSGNLTVALANNPGGATLGGTTTVAVANGIADFSNLTINNAGQGYTLQVSGASVTSATTSAFNVAGDVSQLVVTTQPPANATAGGQFDVKVSAADSLGTVVPTFSGNVAIALANNPSGATLGGTTTVAAASGVADFSTLTIDKAGAGFTLTATSGVLPAATTNAFNVSSAVANHFVVTTQPPASVTAGNTFDVKVTAEDQNGNVDASFTGSVTIALATNPGSATLGGTLTVAAIGGVADFSTLTLDKAASGYSLTATGGALTAATTSTFGVTAAAASQLAVSTQPPSSVTAGNAFDVKIVAQDQFGNVTTGFTGNVTMALANNPGTSTLGGTVTVAAVAGVADFPTLSLDKVGNGYTLTASAGGLTSVTTAALNVTPAAVSQLIVSQQPTSVAAGGVFDVKVSATDQFGNLNSAFAGDVTIGLVNNPGGSTLGGTLTVAAVGGVADFSTLTLDKIGVGYTLKATAASVTDATSAGIDVTPGAATQLVVTSQPPASVTAGAPLDVKITVEDALGNVVTNFNGNVTVALAANPGGSTLGGTTTVAVSNGVADFSNLTLDKVGTGYTLQASSGALSSATTSAIAVTPAAATKFAVTTQPPASVAAGNLFQVAVSAEDQFGNVDPTFTGSVTLALANNPGSATLGGTLTVSAVAGVATFTGLSIDKVGSGYTLSATGGSLTSAISSATNVTPAEATHLVVTTQPQANVTVGAPFSLVVSAADQFNNVVTSFTGNVTIALGANPGSATLGGTLSMAATAGVATFTGLSLDQVGTGYTITATNNLLNSATTSAFNVTAQGVATRLVTTTQPPSSVTAGNAFGLHVSAEDDLGTVDTSFTGNVTLAIGNNPAGGTLGGTLTVAAVAGVADFAGLTLDKAGSGYTLHATGTGLAAATTSAMTVTPAAVTHLVVTTQPPTSTVAGSVFDIKVSAVDQFGNTDTNFSGNVALALANNPGGSALTGTLPVAAVNGVADFTDLSLNKAGTGYTLTATTGTLPSVTTNALNVTPAAATHLVVTTQPPASVTAGAGFGLQVTAEDAFGNVATSFSGNVTIALLNNPASSTLGGTLTVAATGGVATFSGLTLNKAGTGYTLQPTATGLTTAATGSIDVTHAAATQLVFTQQPTTTVANAPFTLQVSAEDEFGNVDPTATGSVTIALATNPGSSNLGGTTTVALTGGIASFTGLTLNKTGTGYTFTASTTGLSTGTSAALAVTAGEASQVVVTTQPPASVVAGTPFDVKVSIEDAQGNVVTNFSGNVTVSIGTNPASGTLGGTKQVAVANGVADFSTLTLDKIGTGYTLSFTTGTLTSATSSAIEVTVGQPSKLAVTAAPPTTATAGSPIDVKVSVEDSSGNVVTGFSGNVTIALASNPGGSTLGGTTTVAVTNGVADFSNLTLNKAGTGYTLTATATSLTSATTSAFAITAAAATQLVVTTQPAATQTAGTAFDVKVSAEDEFGNVDTTFTGNVTLALAGGASGAVLGGTTTVAAVGGVADFSTLTVEKVGTGYTLSATSGSLTSVPSSAFNVVAGVATQLVVTTQPPASVLIDTAFGLSVTAEDAQGNVATSFSGDVKLTIESNPSTGTLGGTTTVAVAGGVATFSDLTLDKLGDGYTLKATSGNLTSATTSDISVTALGAFSGSVYVDTNNDGLKASGEKGIAGVTLTLSGQTNSGQAVSQTATTAADGSFSFQQLSPGTYTVTAAVPSQYVVGQATAGSGVTASSNTQFSFTVNSNSTLTGNFGERGLQPELLTRSYFMGSRIR